MSSLKRAVIGDEAGSRSWASSTTIGSVSTPTSFLSMPDDPDMVLASSSGGLMEQEFSKFKIASTSASPCISLGLMEWCSRKRGGASWFTVEDVPDDGRMRNSGPYMIARYQ
jgi:hypothetical protein